MKRIGIYLERQRAWGRRVCEGIAAFAQEHPDWTLETIEREDLSHPAALRALDAFIARVPDARTAAAFRRLRRPVEDMTAEGFAAAAADTTHAAEDTTHAAEDATAAHTDALIFDGVRQDNLAIGQLAARHFIEHRFVHFAFCGYGNVRFSRERRDSFTRCLELNRFPCAVHETTYDADARTALSERLAPGRDATRLVRWLRALPKPCAVFCANDMRGYQVHKACRAAGLAIPSDIALLGVDNDTLICNFMTPTLSSIDPDAFALGLAAAARLDRRLEQGTAPARPRRVAPRDLVVRGSSQTFPVDPPWLSDALVFIRRNHHRHLTASEVYAHLRLSHTRVDDMFRRRLGTTVQKEIRRVSLDEAERLLRTTDLPVADIARRTGFASPQYFCNVFTATRGRSPSHVRAARQTSSRS